MGFLKNIKLYLSTKNETSSSNFSETYASYNTLDLLDTPLTTEEMLSLAYITRSIQMIANDVAKVTWNHIKWNAKKTDKENMINSKLHWMLNRKPNNEMTAFEFKKLIIWNLMLYGKAPIYPVYKTINEKEQLIELILLAPNSVVLKRDETTGNIYYEITNLDAVKTLKPAELIFITYEAISNVYDVSLKTLFKSTFSKLKENEKSLYNTIKNDVGLSLIVEIPDITDTDSLKQVKSSIDDMIKEQKKSGSVAFIKDRRWIITKNDNYIKSQIDYTTRNAIAREVAAMFGIPASKLGIEDTNKYNTMVERNRAYSDDALKPLLNRITTSLTDHFFPLDMTQEITYSPLDLLSMDPSSLKDFLTSAINNAFMTPNESRDLIGLPAITGGDELFANSALVPIELSKEKAKLDIEVLKRPPALGKDFTKE